MPAEHPVEGRRWPEPLAGRLPAGAGAGLVAEATVALWLQIEAALHPILGNAGVAALFNRSLNLAAAAHPWLTPEPPGLLAPVAPAALKAALAGRPAAEAIAGGQALFQAFQSLLASLVGESLTERLLGPVWTPTSGASPEQDFHR